MVQLATSSYCANDGGQILGAHRVLATVESGPYRYTQHWEEVVSGGAGD
jgi:hypothetical protein